MSITHILRGDTPVKEDICPPWGKDLVSCSFSLNSRCSHASLLETARALAHTIFYCTPSPASLTCLLHFHHSFKPLKRLGEFAFFCEIELGLLKRTVWVAAVPSLNGTSFKLGSYGSFWGEQCLIFKNDAWLTRTTAVNWLSNTSICNLRSRKVSHLSGARKAFHAHIFLSMRTRNCSCLPPVTSVPFKG